MILFSFIGIVFIAVGIIILSVYQFYLKNGRRLKGRIIAYEAYNETVGKYSQQKHQALDSQDVKYYRPLYEYYFQNERVVFCGSGSSKIGKKIGESIEILSLEKGPEFCFPISKTPLVFFSIFTLIGIIFLLISYFQSADLKIQFLPMIASSIIALALYRRAKKSKTNIFESLLKNNQIINEKSLENRKIFWSQEELHKEYFKNQTTSQTMGIIVNLIFISITAFLWTGLNVEDQESVLSLFQNENVVDSFLKIIQQNPLVLAFLIMLLFTVIVMISSIQSINKKNH